MMLLLIHLFICISVNYVDHSHGNDEATFSNFKLWESIGFIMVYILQHFMDLGSIISIWLWIMGVNMIANLTLFFCVYQLHSSSIKRGWTNRPVGNI